MKTLAQKIQYFRCLRGLTPKSLSIHSGVTYTTIIKLENGTHKNISPDTIVKISKVLNVDTGDLLKATENMFGVYDSQRLPKNISKAKFTFIDLFAGIGGIRIGFEKQGGVAVFASEIDKYACQTYRANFGEYPASDITNIEANIIPDHDVLLAGFPCQPFSIAGVSKYKSLGLEHGFLDATKGTLFFDIARIVKTKRPAILFLENVSNLVTHDQGRTFQIIKSTIEDLNYNFYYDLHDGQHFVPQHRKRVIIVAFNNDIFKDRERFAFPAMPVAEHRLRDILETEVEAKYTLSDNLWQYLQAYADKHRQRGNGFGYGLPQLDGVSRTLSARYYKDGSEILIRQKGRNPRRLTPRECARLQGFSDSFIIPVSDTQAYKQFGNSVVVPMIEFLAKPLIRTLEYASR